MADVKPFLVFVLSLADVIAKVFCGRSYCQDYGICYCHYIDYGRCYCHDGVLDVITTCIILICLYCIGRFYCQFFGRSYCHVVVADVITTFYCNLPILQGGRCYSLCICGRWRNHNCLIMILADVIAMVADGITTGQLYFRFSSEMFNRTSS